MLKHMIDNQDIFMCPACGGDLCVENGEIRCSKCNNVYRVEGGVPLLFWSHEWDGSKKDVTEKMKSFYEKTPFPNYEDFENIGDLVQKARSGVFANLLNEQVPFNIRVLEVGCGTGQLSNFLGIAHRFVFGADMCLNSLKLAADFKRKNNLERVGFYQMNLFKPIFKEESFPLVICNGVLHHTGDPFRGFQSISRLVKKGGYIIIGLYNKYGRLSTDLRRLLFGLSGDRFKFMDSRLTREDVGGTRKHTWFLDQYKNPHESKHTIDEVLRWFEKENFNFINGIPKVKASQTFSENENLFKPSPRGSLFDHLLVQSRLVFTGIREGGFFVMIGKKKQ